MSQCAAYNCQNKLGETSDKTFHRFPTWNPALMKEWVTRIGRSKHFSPSSSSILCSDHFEENCFDEIGDVKHIRADAAPTLFFFDGKQVHQNSDETSTEPQIIDVISLKSNSASPTPSTEVTLPVTTDTSVPSSGLYVCNNSLFHVQWDVATVVNFQVPPGVVDNAQIKNIDNVSSGVASTSTSTVDQVPAAENLNQNNLSKSSLNEKPNSLQVFRDKIGEICRKEKAEKRKKVVLQLLLSFKRFAVNQQKIKIVLNRQRLLRRKMMQTAMLMVLLTQQKLKTNS